MMVDTESASDALDHASAVSTSATGSVILFARRPSGEIDPFDLNPTSSLMEAFHAAAVGTAADAREHRTLVPYVPGRKPDEHEVAFLSPDDVPALTPILEHARSGSPHELFSTDSPLAKRLRLLAVVLTEPNPGQIVFLQATSLRAQLGRSGRFGAVLTGAAYDKVDPGTLLFDPRFDAIVAQNVVLITNQRSFETSVGFLDLAGTAALKTLEDVAADLNIENEAELIEAVQRDSNMIAKLRGIQAKMDANPTYQDSMSMQNVVPFVKARPELGFVLVGEPGGERIVFQTDPQHRWQILKLLDDDYDLVSQLTNMRYEANSKSLA